MNSFSRDESVAPQFPLVYLMVVDAPNGAGNLQDGDHVMVNTLDMPEIGDLVCVHPRKGGAVLVELTMAIPPHIFNAIPYRENPDSTGHALIVGYIAGTSTGVMIKCSEVWAVHKCDGKYIEDGSDQA